MKLRFGLLGASAVVASGAAAFLWQDAGWSPLPKEKRPNAATSREYNETIQRTAQMVGDVEARNLAQKYGLNILNLTWEDTGRYKGSSVGPNISDMTIQVGSQTPDRQFEVTCMPVIRYPNFSDITCDMDPRDFTLLVGNERGLPLKRVSLYEFLENPTNYLSNPKSWLGKFRSLLAPRDTKVLVSAQACFLPVPKQGIATFNPVIFNYQSYSGDPAVLTILATREGTSTTVIDNKRDAFATGAVWGQRLFLNQNGKRASLTGQRMSDYVSSGKTGTSRGGSEGLNMVLLIQVPLKQKNEMRFGQDVAGAGGGFGGAMSKEPAAANRSDVENAVIGHGALEGPFTEIDNLAIQRDDRYPVRVTVQFYKATSNGVVSEYDIRAIKEQIDRVYALSDYVGSLVVNGETGRATEYEGSKVQPPDWWEKFWQRHEQNTGDTRIEARQKLIQLLGKNYMRRPVSELYLHDLLRK